MTRKLGRWYEEQWKDVNNSLTVMAMEERARADAGLDRVIAQINKSKQETQANEVHFH